MTEAVAQKRTLKVDEAAKILGISTKTAYEAIAAGQIPAVRIGRRWIVPVAAIDKMLAGPAVAT